MLAGFKLSATSLVEVQEGTCLNEVSGTDVTPLQTSRESSSHYAGIPKASHSPKRPRPETLTGLPNDGNGSDSIAPGNGNPGNRADSNTCNGMGTCNSIHARNSGGGNSAAHDVCNS